MKLITHFDEWFFGAPFNSPFYNFLTMGDMLQWHYKFDARPLKDHFEEIDLTFARQIYETYKS